LQKNKYASSVQLSPFMKVYKFQLPLYYLITNTEIFIVQLATF